MLSGNNLHKLLRVALESPFLRRVQKVLNQLLLRRLSLIQDLFYFSVC